MHRTILITMVAALVFAISSPLMAQSDFSADIVSHDQGKDSNRATVYVTKDRMRVESQGQNGREGVFIVNFATQTSDVLMPEHKMYMEMHSNQGPGAQRTWAYFRAADVDNACSDWLKMSARPYADCHKVGNETVNGRNTVKYQGTSQSGEVYTVWLDSKLAFPIKWQGKNGGGEMQNIKVGSLSASLFEIPPDYQKMQMPMGMPGMPPGGPGAPPRHP